MGKISAVTNGYFSEALNVRIPYHSDTYPKVQILNRLMFDAYYNEDKGPARDQEELIIGNWGVLHAYRHQPTWAPIEASTFTREGDLVGENTSLRPTRLPFIVGIILRTNSPEEPSLAISYDEQNSSMRVNAEDPIGLEPGQPLEDAQSLVTRATSDFFSNVK